MGLFPQFPYSNLHELNLDWIIEQIRQVTGEGVVLSVNGLSGVVTLYTENNITLPDCHYDTEWSVSRLIDEKIAGLKFTGEKFFYITKNHDAEEFTVQEVYTSGNQPPYPVTSVNDHDGAVVLAGDNLPYVIDGPYTIEEIVEAIESAIGAVILGKQCSQAVTAGQYVFLIMSNISGRADGLYKAVNNVSANTDWTSADLQAVSGGLGAEMATAENDIVTLSNNIAQLGEYVGGTKNAVNCPNGGVTTTIGTITLNKGKWIIFANGWSPLDDVQSNATQINVSDTYGCSTIPFRLFSMSGLANVHSDNTVLNLNVVNWESEAKTANTLYNFYATRVGS